jgi:hypothetical protein
MDSIGSSTTIDPVCGVGVSSDSPHHSEHAGRRRDRRTPLRLLFKRMPREIRRRPVAPFARTFSGMARPWTEAA